jgi:hypothetical protein
MALKVATQPARVPARIERIGKVEEGNYGPYRSVLFKGAFELGMDSVKTAGELWRRVPCDTSDDMAQGMGMILSLVPGKNGMVWDIALDPDAPPVTGPTAGQQHQAPASTGSGQPAPAATGYVQSQPLDRVGEPGRRDAILAELEFRAEVMDLALSKAARAMASKVGILDKEGKHLTGNPADLNQAAIAAMANTMMIGLFDNRSYFGGGSQNAPHQ